MFNNQMFGKLKSAMYALKPDYVHNLISLHYYTIFSQVVVTDMHTQFIENIIFIMKNILDSRAEQPAEHLGITSIEFLMLTVVRYVRHLDSSIHAIQIKTKLCQLVEAVSALSYSKHLTSKFQSIITTIFTPFNYISLM